MILNWKVSKEDHDLIVEIAKRVEPLTKKFGVRYSTRDVIMDLTAVHANAISLRLGELLAADDGTFGHDIWGIRRHLNRRTGVLEDCFVPRCAREVVSLEAK